MTTFPMQVTAKYLKSQKSRQRRHIWHEQLEKSLADNAVSTYKFNIEYFVGKSILCCEKHNLTLDMYCGWEPKKILCYAIEVNCVQEQGAPQGYKL